MRGVPACGYLPECTSLGLARYCMNYLTLPSGLLLISLEKRRKRGTGVSDVAIMQVSRFIGTCMVDV